MEEQHRKRIRNNYQVLSDKIPVRKLTKYMFQEGIISKGMMEDIMWCRPRDRPFEFLSTLQRRGPEAFSVFIKGQKACGSEDLVELLQDKKPDEKANVS